MATTTYDLLDRLLDDGLPNYLSAMQANGASLQAIAKDLLVNHEVDVSTETVRKWVAVAKARKAA